MATRVAQLHVTPEGVKRKYSKAAPTADRDHVVNLLASVSKGEARKARKQLRQVGLARLAGVPNVWPEAPRYRD